MYFAPLVRCQYASPQARISAIAILIALACFISFAVVRAEPIQSKRVALIVGNSKYENTTVLANPRNDAAALAAALTRLQFDVVLALDVTQAQMAVPVRKFVRRLRGADVALFYYAGHGLSFEGQNYIVPVDALAKDAMDIRFGMHPIRTITDEMARWTHLNIVMLDACRDNPLVRSLDRSLDGATRSASVRQGLSRLEQVGRQSYIMLATKDGEVAADGDGRHSPFSQALLNHIETEGLEISGLARKVRKEVREITEGRQIPLTVGSLDDAFYFHPHTSAVGEKSAVAAPPETIDREAKRRRDHLYWESVKDLNSIELFRTYLDRFPTGDFVKVARARIEQIKSKYTRDKDVESSEKMSAKTKKKDADKAYRDAVADGSEEGLREFIGKFPNHRKAADLKLMLDERDSWRVAERGNTRESYERYLLAFPRGVYALAARDRIAAFTTRDVRGRHLPEPVPQQTYTPPQYVPPAVGPFAPSFNCIENTGAAEQAICGDRRLSELDVELSRVYTLVRGRLSKRRGNALRNSQRRWLKQRDACGADNACIESIYVRRIQDLHGWRG